MLCLQAGVSLHAQQSSLITHYMFTNMATNPAYAGGSGGINLTGLVRQQWMGWKDDTIITNSNPQTFLLTVDSPVKMLHGGLGGSISQDQIGAFKNIVMKLGYAYRMEMGSGDLSFGLQGSLLNISYDGSKYNPIEENDQVLQPKEKKSDMSFDLGLGVFYRVPDKYYVGLSAENILQTKGKKTGYQLRRTYYLNGGYQWTPPNNPLFEVLPSAQFMFDGAALQLNASALVMYSNKIYGGIGYRLQDAVSVLAGVFIKGIHIGVAYDISTSAMHKYNSGGLEVMVNYCFKIDTDKFRKSYRNTRFL
ncbi:MAG: PorP/SprF family type IX secretion system membrane protein [Bacteroidetes bacterium]|nr:PorP/SprF family type IX secretion system membrane protein [Bacteroidota bacterium]